MEKRGVQKNYFTKTETDLLVKKKVSEGIKEPVARKMVEAEAHEAQQNHTSGEELRNTGGSFPSGAV